MDLKSLLQPLSVAGIACQGALALVLLYRRTWRTFPLFSLYFGVSFAATLCIYGLGRNAESYLYGYWLTETLGIVLGFAVVYEIFRIVFAGHVGLRRLATLTFRWVLAILLVVGVVVFARQASLGFRGGVATAVLVLEEATRIIEVGLLMCLFLLSSAFGLHWRQQVFGIALGLGLFVAVELITVTILGQVGMAARDAVNIVRILGFNASLLIWIGYLLTPERAAGKAELPQRSQLEQWNQAVMELIKQ